MGGGMTIRARSCDKTLEAKTDSDNWLEWNDGEHKEQR